MSLEEHIYSILIVSSSDSFNSSLAPLIPESKFSPIRIEKSINSARRVLSEYTYDFVIINSPLPDDVGIKLATEICEKKSSVPLLMVHTELYETTYNKVFEYGTYVIPKPTSKSVIFQALDWMVSTRERLKKFELKTLSTEEKMKEIRLVNRAKWILIDNLKMSEYDAHKYIEKQAMNRCVSKREIAEEIIKTYL